LRPGVFKAISGRLVPYRSGAEIYFNLALFVCAVVIKCANEDIGDGDHETISGSIISVPAIVRSTPCAFAQRMCWYLFLFSTRGPI